MKQLLIDFDILKVGDKLWDIRHGEMIIIKIHKNTDYPIIAATFNGNEYSYTKEGKHLARDVYPILFTSNPFEHISEHPKWMEVSDIGQDWKKRYVIHKSPTGFFAIVNATNSDELSNQTGTQFWTLAREIQIPEPIEVTLEDIAAKFGVNVNQIKIKK